MSLKEEKKPIVGTLPKNSVVSAESLASYLGCSVDAVKKYCQRYEVKRVVIAGKWLIDIDDLLSK
ncbi:hypothetical protein DRP04_10935 [Archaeoglobales archaeon]|nr:MAG: hypothetical protein DRP04_10935 [Archaeoglobales archaeon]